MERSSCILPSNAPALHDSIIDDIGVPRPILQERCNNRQQDFLDGDHRKHGLYQPAENFYNSAAQGYLASSQSSHTGYAASTWLADEDERVRQEAARLWRMLSRSDAYRKYRARQPKDCREQDQKWPEHMELAFFSALVKYPPMGRRKQMHEGKPRGRNELIAYAIEKWTGEARSRKQVSSHIQVLKPLFKEYPKIMRYMSKEDLDHRRHHRHNSNDMLRRRFGASASMRPLDFNSIDQGAIYGPQQHAALPPPRQMLSSSPALVPACFEMNARDTTSDPPRSLHCFTRFHKRAEQQPLYISDLQDESSGIPKHLRDMLGDKDALINCDVILAESSIELMAMHAPGDSTELGIQIEFNSTYEYALYDHFESHTRFYTGDELATEPKSVLGYDHHYKRLHAVAGTFGSGFWAGKLGELSLIMRKAYKKKGDLVPARGAVQADDERLQQAREHANQTLEALSAVQEIFAVPRGSIAAASGYGTESPNPERVLIVGWTFRHADAGEVGATTWRRVVLPHQQSSKDDSSLKQESQTSFLDTGAGALKQEANNPYGGLTLETMPGSGLITPNTSTHPSFDASAHNGGFDLDPLSAGIGGPFSAGSIAAMPLSAGSSSAPSLYQQPQQHHHSQHHHNPHHAHHHQPTPTMSAATSDLVSTLTIPHAVDHNALDFTGGQINVWMEPSVSMQGYYDITAAPPSHHASPLEQQHPSSAHHHHSQQHHPHHQHHHMAQHQAPPPPPPHTPVGYGPGGGDAYNPRGGPSSWGGYGALLEDGWPPPPQGGSTGGGGSNSGAGAGAGNGSGGGAGASGGYGDGAGKDGVVIEGGQGKHGHYLDEPGQGGGGGGGGHGGGYHQGGRRDSGMLGL
ncbi:Transcription factor [Lasiodiplodia theobromae]|uniref:Transcription factor n=1 Tax=Lasiodiplodia theobromae TaxID=45133 RepID=UPI0015C3708D|nr:Transcription factor [Lasiodiplodia theobromae]KAF4545637.1 Transcription factor [Lasiodiplodia theobromae]